MQAAHRAGIWTRPGALAENENGASGGLSRHQPRQQGPGCVSLWPPPCPQLRGPRPLTAQPHDTPPGEASAPGPDCQGPGSVPRAPRAQVHSRSGSGMGPLPSRSSPPGHLQRATRSEARFLRPLTAQTCVLPRLLRCPHLLSLCLIPLAALSSLLPALLTPTVRDPGLRPVRRPGDPAIRHSGPRC